MALSIDNSAKSFVNSGTAPTLTFTIAASANLLVIEWDSADGSGGQNLTACTAGGVSMSLVPSGAVINGLFSSQLWFLKSPPTGSVTITGTLATPISFQMLYATSFIGADSTTPLGTAVTAGSGTGVNSAVTASGGAAGDIYLGTTSIYATTITSGGSQTVLQSQPNAGGTVSSSVDTLPGSGSGAFSWTGGGTTSNGWTAAAVAVKAVAGAAQNSVFLQNRYQHFLI